MNTIHWSKEKRIKLHCFTMIIKLKSIEEAFGTVEEFVSLIKTDVICNGELIVLYDMMCPSYFFNALAEDTLIPKGILLEEDFICTNEQNIWGVGGICQELIGKVNSNLVSIKWLGSIVELDADWIWLEDVSLS